MADAPLPPLASRRLRRAMRLLLRLRPAPPPLEYQLLGRTLLHAALVGTAAGLAGSGFFVALELVQRWALEAFAGYRILRASGEHFLPPIDAAALRPWALLVLPALGGLAAGLLARYVAPETAGGGGDATIDAYHRRGATFPARTAPVKALASVLTLGTGGAGGREGPTMQLGAALGALVGRLVPATPRERRILFVAGVAAGISAVFRTPLGAALFAVEVLHRDDFEADALVPAVLASVVAFAVTSLLLVAEPLFGRLPAHPFVPRHLPLYALLGLVASFAGAAFVGALRTVHVVSARLPVAQWARPALGGLAVGVLGVVAAAATRHAAAVPHGAGLLGGGYGLAEVAIRGTGLTPGWAAAGVLLALAAAKLAASALTIGSGGSAGDFAPALLVGGLVGGAFGHAAAALTADPAIDPGAFALVGMGALYGGVAHVPLAALVLVSELAGSYDLLVPLMLAVTVAFVAVRRVSLYRSQPAARAARAAEPAPTPPPVPPPDPRQDRSG